MKNMEALSKIQRTLKAPKSQENKFGGFWYRSCEDILEAVKPLLGTATLTLHDDIVLIGDRYYVKATATLQDDTASASASAFARESFEKKGMDAAQITGATSSYARKYALNGLFCIDDTKDADHDGHHASAPSRPAPPIDEPFHEEKTVTDAELAAAFLDAHMTTKGRFPGGPNAPSLAKCERCQKDVAQVVQSFSVKKYGKVYCRTCQPIIDQKH